MTEKRASQGGWRATLLKAGLPGKPATARGLCVHQMAGIEVEKIRETYGVPAGWEPVAGIALGYLGDSAERAPRARKPQAEFIFAGGWGRPAGF